jgi:hypothetical protein
VGDIARGEILARRKGNMQRQQELVNIQERKEPTRYPEGTLVRMLPTAANWDYWKGYATMPWRIEALLQANAIGVRISQKVSPSGAKITTLAAWRDLVPFGEPPCGCGNPARHKLV